MSRATKSLVSIIIAIEALLLLLPATLLYVGGMIFAVLAFFDANKGGVTPAFLALAAFLLLPGYGLYSLWWLVARHRKVSPREVPRFIWGGTIVGGLVALLFISPLLLSGFTPTQFISQTDQLTTMLVFGGGPLLVALTLLVIMQPWRKCGQL